VNSKIGPFELGKVHCVDCLEAMKQLPDGCVDAVVTDPPYGIGFDYASHKDDEEGWVRLMDSAVPLMRMKASFVVMPSCRIQMMEWWYAHHTPDWLIAWYKGSPGHMAHVGFNDWEPHLVWGKPPAQMHDFFQTKCGFHVDGHPCPKPIEYGEWLVQRAATDGGIVLDPFAGSGTTGVACVKLNRQFLGFEIDPEYCRIANERIEAARKGLTVQELKAGQKTLF